VLRTGDEVVEGHVCSARTNIPYLLGLLDEAKREHRVASEEGHRAYARAAKLTAERDAIQAALIRELCDCGPDLDPDLLHQLEDCRARVVLAEAKVVAERDEAIADHQGTLDQLRDYLDEHADTVEELAEVKRERDEALALAQTVEHCVNHPGLYRAPGTNCPVCMNEMRRVAVEECVALVERVSKKQRAALKRACGFEAGQSYLCTEILAELKREGGR